MKNIIVLKDLSKSYNTNKGKIEVLKNISLKLETGKMYAIMGHSGSGKSTLINILGLIDEYDEGSYILFDKNPKNLSDKELSNLRMKNIGFIFQEFYLNNTLKAYENVIVPMLINKDIQPHDRKGNAIKLLEEVELSDRIEHFPKELSGGEQQRVAIARSLANNPDILLADEPTGNLDEENEKKIFKILKKLAKEGKCVIVVSHSNEVKKYADVVYSLEKGKLSSKNENK